MAKYKLPPLLANAEISACFVCGESISKETRTLEHLIPQWMIRRFGLSSESVTISDGSRINYMDLLVPCCRDCNCHLLSPIEATFARALKNTSPRHLSSKLLAVWASKVIAGFHVYENLLEGRQAVCDLSDNNVPANELSHMYLRMLRHRITLSHRFLEFPFSIFVFDTRLPQKHRARFDFQIVPSLEAFYARLGRWAVLFRADGGYIALHGAQFFAPFYGHRLAPLQVEELAAHFFTMANRQSGTMLYVRRHGPALDEVSYIPTFPRQAFSDDEDISDFVGYFTYLARLSPEQVVSNGRRRTFLFDDAGNVLRIPRRFDEAT